MKRIVCLLLTLTMMFSILSINASAARAEEFLSEVALVYEDSIEEAREAIEGTDWKLLEYDLNANADYMFDNGVYLIYKTSTNVEDAITDLRVMDMYGGYSTSNYEKQLEASRAKYAEMIKELRKATTEFKALYESGDAMAALAYRQMNYYKDTRTVGGTETDMLMGDFFLNMPEDSKVVQVLFEGNGIIVSNLISLLAVGISGEDETTLASKVEEMYAIKDTLTHEVYHESAVALSEELTKIRASILRYDALAEEYDLEDENMSEDKFLFMSEYAAIAILMDEIKMGETTLTEMVRSGDYTPQDLYPVVAAFTSGQKALIEMGQLETILKYNAPSKPIAELNAILDEMEENFKDENGVLIPYDVYLGVDRSIFKGSFAMTTAADRQQALTGETWGLDDASDRSFGISVGYITASAIDVAVAGVFIGIHIKNNALVEATVALSAKGKLTVKAATDAVAFSEKWVPAIKVAYVVTIGVALIILGSYGISTWYNYYNPDYTEIPNTMIDVRETDLGDKYIKYNAAKVFGKDDKMNADFNAYEGKEWIALYYTKDATAGNCLTPNFVFKDNDSTIARRHQGISMFGETNAFNLNSHVYSSNAKGTYLTIRYSTTKKAAADVPNVVGSMFAESAFYSITAITGIALGVGGTLFVQSYRKKKEDELESDESQESSDPIEPEIPIEDLERVESAEIEENKENKEILESEETFENTEIAEASEMVEDSENIESQETTEEAESTEESTENAEDLSESEESVEE